LNRTASRSAGRCGRSSGASQSDVVEIAPDDLAAEPRELLGDVLQEGHKRRIDWVEAQEAPLDTGDVRAWTTLRGIQRRTRREVELGVDRLARDSLRPGAPRALEGRAVEVGQMEGDALEGEAFLQAVEDMLGIVGALGGEVEVGAEPAGKSEPELPECSAALEDQRMVSSEQALGRHPGEEVLLGELEVGLGRGASTVAS
jgi:hypothetical protein